MNKKLWILSAILAATVVAAPAQAPFTNPRVVQELGLTPQQQQQLQDLTFKQARENLDLRHEKAIKELALRQEMAKETPNEAAVNKAIDDLSLVKARQAKVRFRHMQDMRAVLTPEQWQKVKAKLGERRAAMREGMRDRMRGRMGRGGMGGPGGPGYGAPPQPPPPPPGGGPGPNPGFAQGPEEDDGPDGELAPPSDFAMDFPGDDAP